MEDQKPEIGLRQTVDEAVLKGYGPGQLVWGNGPAFFLAENGKVVMLHRVDLGGASSNPKRSWRSVWVDRGVKVQADVTKHGSSHSRFFSPLFGDGWLVHEMAEGDGHQIFARFDTLDDVVRVRWEVNAMSVGRPAYMDRTRKTGAKAMLIDDPDEMNWITHRARDGSVFSFRRGGPPPPPGTFIPMNDWDYKLLTPKARKAYDEARTIAEGSDRDGQLSLFIASDR